MQCCVRRRAARRELLKLKTEARSVERFRELNKGMEVKLMQLQVKADYQVGAARFESGPRRRAGNMAVRLRLIVLRPERAPR